MVSVKLNLPEIWQDIDGERAGDRRSMSEYGDVFYEPPSVCELSHGMLLTQRYSESNSCCKLQQGQLRLPDGSILQWGNYLDDADDACMQCTVHVLLDGLVTELGDVGIHDNFLDNPFYIHGSGLKSVTAKAFLARVDALLCAQEGTYTIESLVNAMQVWSCQSLGSLNKTVHEIGCLF
jgi:hypothetical protein